MRWDILTPDPKLVKRLQREFDCTEIIARVMVNRGIVSLNASRAFFEPTLNQFHDPFLMQDMERAVSRIIASIKRQQPILIFGDYDVDGTTGAALLFLVLRAFGASVSTYIPNRETEGYGLSPKGIDYALKKGAKLIITCDCGINALKPVDYAREQGIDVIITDHHTPDETLPDAQAILNPKRSDCNYPFKGLCGGGVVFKLASALNERLKGDFDSITGGLDLITLGTAADIVPLVDENRVIVHQGLKLLQASDRPGLKALLSKTGLGTTSPSVGQLVFTIAPRINAAGRLGDANRAVELLTTSDPKRAKQLVDELELENRRRQEIQQAVVDEALLMVNAEVDLENERAIVLARPAWHAGVVGIVASRIKEEFHRPTVIISFDQAGQGKGSARSIPGFDLYQALTEVREHLLDYGGHPMAAGLQISAGNLDRFRSAFIAYANDRLTTADLTPTIKLDGEIELPHITGRFMSFLDKLSPFGPGNMRPKFCARKVQVVGNPRVLGNGDHILFKARQGKTVYRAIGFNQSRHYEKLIKGFPVDLAFVVELNEWQGQSNIQLNIRDIKLSQSDNLSA